MIKVMHLISDGNIGGAGILLINLLGNIDRRGFEFTAVVPRGSSLTERLRNIGIETEEADIPSDRSASLAALFPLMKIIRRARPDIVHTHGMFTARIAAALCGVPVRIATRHCSYGPGIFATPILRPICRALDGILTDKTVATADAAKQDLTEMGLDPKKIEVIINGSNPLRRISSEEKTKLRRSLGISDSDFVVGIAARLEPVKGHETFIRAAERLCSEDDGWKFLIVGGGSLKEKLKAQVHKSGLDGKVIFTGFVADVAPLMNIFDLNANCSIGTETSCLALSEGMSLGLPAVASRFGGNVFMVRSGENGYLFTPGSDSEFAGFARQIRQDRALYKTLSENAKARYDSIFRADVMAEKYRELYLSLMQSKEMPSEARGTAGS